MDQTIQKIYHFDHEVIKKLDAFILTMPVDKWFKIGKDETKLAVIKDWIDKDILRPYYLTLSENNEQFIKRRYENSSNNTK